MTDSEIEESLVAAATQLWPDELRENMIVLEMVEGVKLFRDIEDLAKRYPSEPAHSALVRLGTICDDRLDDWDPLGETN